MPSNTSFICFPIGVLSMTRFFVGFPVPQLIAWYDISSTQGGVVPWFVFHAPGWAGVCAESWKSWPGLGVLGLEPCSRILHTGVS